MFSPRNRYVYFPDAAEVPESQAVNVRNRSFAIGALVDIPAPGAQACSSPTDHPSAATRSYVKENRLHYVYSFVGMFEQMIVADRRRPDRGQPHPVGVVRQGRRGPARLSTGILSLSTAIRRSARAASRPSQASS